MELQGADARFVLLGLPEDIGVRANYGRGGAHTAWQPALENILNIQSNQFLSGKEIVVAGHVDFSDLMAASAQLNPRDEQQLNQLRDMVKKVDERVCEIMQVIISCNKIPIVIGGGHNNSYPNIKAAALALKQAHKGIHVINCDPHSDFRPLEGRHSGNGFSYAFGEHYLYAYSVLAMHESYNTAAVLERFKQDNDLLTYSTYEDIFVRGKISFQEALQQGIDFCRGHYCGVELDMDAITNVPSSAKTSSGISPLEARQYVYACARNLRAVYLHIAEGAPVLAHIKADNKTGKLIAYLVSDFIKGVLERDTVE